jgi:hypothetical protein
MQYLVFRRYEPLAKNGPGFDREGLAPEKSTADKR